MMNFSERWISLVMLGLRTVTYTLMVNGYKAEVVPVSRGLKQGDPLSPYLFLFCAEGLTTMLDKAQRDGRLGEVAAAKSGPLITHLLFADDSFLFHRATPNESKEIMEVLRVYKKVSGQQNNRDISDMMFRSNTIVEVKREVMSILGVREELNCESYLGLPLAVGKCKSNEFRKLKERV